MPPNDVSLGPPHRALSALCGSDAALECGTEWTASPRMDFLVVC